MNADRYDLSAKAFQAAADRGYRAGTSLYNEACALSRAGNTPAALDLLQKALDAGFDQPDMFRSDDDLDNIRGDRRFAELAREAKDLELPGFPNNRWGWSGHTVSPQRTKWREAARRFEDYANKHPEKGRAWFNLGFASLAGDRPEAAAEAFQKAFDLGYRKPTTQYNIACSYARADQKEKPSSGSSRRSTRVSTPRERCAATTTSTTCAAIRGSRRPSILPGQGTAPTRTERLT